MDRRVTKIDMGKYISQMYGKGRKAREAKQRLQWLADHGELSFGYVEGRLFFQWTHFLTTGCSYWGGHMWRVWDTGDEETDIHILHMTYDEIVEYVTEDLENLPF